jgi:hypothetical protein
MTLFRRSDVSEILSPDVWLDRGRKIRRGQRPVTQVWLPHPVPVYGDWQTREDSA